MYIFQIVEAVLSPFPFVLLASFDPRLATMTGDKLIS
jgi:hypothetical protein